MVSVEQITLGPGTLMRWWILSVSTWYNYIIDTRQFGKLMQSLLILRDCEVTTDPFNLLFNRSKLLIILPVKAPLHQHARNNQVQIASTSSEFTIWITEHQ